MFHMVDSFIWMNKNIQGCSSGVCRGWMAPFFGEKKNTQGRSRGCSLAESLQRQWWLTTPWLIATALPGATAPEETDDGEDGDCDEHQDQDSHGK